MKWNILSAKVRLMIGLSAVVLSAAAAEPLFYVSLIKDESGLGRSLIVRTKTSGHAYNYLGLKITNPDFSFASDNTACTINPKNNWCLFSAGNGNVRRFRVTKRTAATASKENFDIQLALNAKSQPVSIQNYSVLATTPGRIIGYLYGWVTPPAAADVAKAHYTHVLIAFGLFSTSSPGTINLDAISGFDLKTYVDALHAEGISVLLSLGGASTNIPDTTVSFTQAVSLATSPNDFISTFTTSMASLVSTYGFDGFDFDIESGLNEATSFSNPAEGCGDNTYRPTCDIANLSSIINNFHTSSPNSLLTLAPQVPNIAATPSFTPIWGNYASLVMQTATSLEWVGFQTYNSGCAYGIDRVCYPLADTTLTSSPDAAVAFATDLLEDWPATTNTGIVTGFQPYKSLLTPSQVVLGYTVVNGAGSSDGAPPAVIPVVKDAIQCLRTGEACDNYTPPNTYPNIGGVFDWTLNYDASNNYAFSNGLYPCVVNGDCAN